MQPMPAKNRTAVMVGAALLAVVVGAVAVWTSRKPAEQPPTQLEQLGLEPMDGSGTVSETAPSGVANAGTGSGTGTEPTQAAGAQSGTEAVTAAGKTVPMTHTVKEHETLRSIAMQYYGNPDYSGYIEELNELSNPDTIPAGKELKLPRPEDLPKAH